MNKEIARNMRLGIFVIFGVLLLITGMYFIGTNRNMFGRTVKLNAIFHNVGGLQVGNNIRYAGIDVGTVEKIAIVNDTTIRVTMVLEADMKNVIRKNAIVSLGTDGLMGNKLINIVPSNSDAVLIADGDQLIGEPATNTEEMLRTLAVTNENVAVISANLRSITQNINESRGTLYTVLMDTTLASKIRHALDNIEAVSNNIHDISNDLILVMTDVKQGKGFIGTLVKDTLMTKDLAQAITEVKDAGTQINTSAGDLKQLLNKANNGNGTVATLINDTASANSLKRSLENIEISTFKFSENMEALKHNFLLRPYFKKQEKQNKSSLQK